MRLPKTGFVFLFSLIITLSTIDLLSQEVGTLRGNVIDSLTGEALPFANILIEETSIGASTDLKGNFIITGIPAKRSYQVRVTYLGYKTKTISIDISPKLITQLRVELSLESIRLQTVEKIGEKYDRPNEPDIGLQQINIKEIERLPQGVETDIFRSIQSLPGVNSTGDISARYYVRGGNSNQNLVLFNGTSVYNPFHALGLFSIIDPESINALEFHRGGFTAEQGGRVSSVLNLVTKDGNQNRFSANASASFLTVKSFVEGPLPIGSFIISGRISTFNQTLKKFLNYKDAPFDFYDVSFKFNYVSKGGKSLTKLSLHGFNSLDRLNNNSPNEASYRWTNNIYGGYLFLEWEDVPIYSETNFSYSGFFGEVAKNESLARPRKNTVDDVTLMSDFTYINNNRDEIKVGYLLKSIATKLEFENLRGATSMFDRKALQLSLYGKYKFLRWENLGIDIGSRVNLITLASQKSSIFEPRMSMTYRIFPWLALKGAWGIYTQELITLTNEKEVISLFEPWLITPSNSQPLKSTHYIAGIEYDGIQNFSFSIEAYYKTLNNLLEQNEQKITATDPDFIKGNGEAYGSEYLIKYIDRSLSIMGSYSLSWAYKNFNGWLSYPKYDIRHSVSLNLTYDLGFNWQTSISWFFNSGLPFTPISGYYDKLYMGNLFNIGALYGNYTPYTIIGDLNTGRLPTYHRLDINLSKRFELSFLSATLSLNILNVYNRKNIFYFDRKTGQQVNMLPIFPSATIRVEI